MIRAFIESFEYRERFFGAASGNQFAPPDEGLIAEVKRWLRPVVLRAVFGVAAS